MFSKTILNEGQGPAKESDLKKMDKSKKTAYDLSAPITEKTVVYPGDPAYSSEKIVSLEAEGPFNLCHMHLGNHTGTHIDFPGHVLKDAKMSHQFSIQHLMGSGLIIKVPDEVKSISKKFVSEQSDIIKNDIVFFKTANSKLSKQDKFTEKYVYIEPEAAEELLKKGVKIVGIDYISVDGFDAEGLPVHKSLLSNEVLIVEGLELNNAPIGRCEIFIMPLHVPNMDGLPARVVALK